MRGALAGVMVAMALAACGRGGVVEDVVAASRAAYPVMWGEEMSAEVEAAQRAKVSCLWEDLDRRGADAGEELRCFERRLRAWAGCDPKAKAEVCMQAANAACTPSRHFRGASAACKSGSDPF